MRHLILPCLLAGTMATFCQADETVATEELDRQICDSLRDVHNNGADLYNDGDPQACFRLFQGALQTVRPLLAHHPKVQAKISKGLASADAEMALNRQAFLLHDLIEEIRADIRPSAAGESEPMPEPEPMPKPEKIKPMPKEVDPKPMPKPAAGSGSVAGIVTFKGKPLSGARVFVIGDAPSYRILSTDVDDTGKYEITGVPTGEYTVIISATKDGRSVIPEKYTLTSSSPITISVASGSNEVGIALE